MAVPVTVRIDMELSGPGGGWTTITDVLSASPIRAKYGINDQGPNGRVASAGTLAFALDNSTKNSGAKLGYYSPSNSNLRAGFQVGIGVRLVIVYDGVSYYKWVGTIDSIRPGAGMYGARQVQVTCVDWMDAAARTKLRGIPVQLNQRSDQVFRTIVAAMTKQPQATEVGFGMETYPYALDNTRDEGIAIISEFQRLAKSELGFIYVKGNTTTGGVLTFEDRRNRGIVSDNIATFDGTRLSGIDSSITRDGIINRVQVQIHPRRIDAAATSGPQNVSGLKFWAKADALDLFDGDRVASWPDSSGLGFDLSQSTAARRPLFKSGIVNGNPVVRFAKANTEYMNGAAISNLLGSTAGTMFVVMRASQLGSAVSDSGAKFGLHTNGTEMQSFNDDGNLDGIGIADEDILNNWRIGTWMHSAGTLYVGRNNTQDAGLGSKASGTTSSLAGTLNVGSWANVSDWFDGDIAEIVIYNVALSEADRKIVEGYLAVKYNIDVPYAVTGGTLSTLFTLSVSPPPQLQRNTRLTFRAPYRDPSQRETRVGGYGLVTPVPTTDYLFNTAADGSGTDITSQLLVTPTFGGNTASLEVFNAGPLDGHLTFLQVRGRGIYDYETVLLTAEDLASQEAYGENLLTMDMPYQGRLDVAQEAAHYLLSQNNVPREKIHGVSLVASDDFSMKQILQREISDRIGLKETVTGISDSGINSSVASGYFINSIALEILRGIIRASWTVTPADADTYWILEVPGFTELDLTTRLAYGLFSRFWILDTSPLGVDTRVNQ